MGEYGTVFQNEPVDISEEFAKQENYFFVCDGLEEFEPEAALGRIRWKSFSLKQRVSYHQLTVELEDYKVWEDLPSGEYEDDRSLPFDLSFITPRTVRLRLSARPEGSRGRPTLMLQGEPPVGDFWKANDNGSHVTYRGPSGSVTVERDPLHWGGDAENSDGGMAGTLRGGLSLGLCGFSFWSHFIGGFPYATPEDLYRRWLAFGVLGSHSRCHGRPPTEPWEYGETFTDNFRKMVELRYRLMPNVYAQAAVACREGHPMLRTLFFEYLEDRTSWLVEDEYLFGTDILIAPLMEAARSRDVYLPPGVWTDYQDGKRYEGTRWHRIRAGEVSVVMLLRDGAAVPHAQLAQSTEDIDWGEIELRVFGAGNSARGFFCHPQSGEPHLLRLRREDDGFSLEEDPLDGRVTWRIETFP